MFMHTLDTLFIPGLSGIIEQLDDELSVDKVARDFRVSVSEARE